MQLNVRHYAAEEGFVRSLHYDILAEPLFTATDVMHLSVTSRLKVNREVKVMMCTSTLVDTKWFERRKSILPMVMEMGLKGIAIEYIFWGN